MTPPYRRGVQDDDTRSVVGARLATAGGSEGAPALVDNVETLADVTTIVEHGSDWFRSLGTDRSPGTIVCTVSGATRRAGVGEVPMGTTLREAIDLIGWGPRPGHEVRVVLSGTANPLIPALLLDTPLTYEAMRDAGSGLGSAGFIVFDETTSPAAIAAGVSRFLSVESCGQCEPCKADGLFIAGQLERSLRDPSASVDLAALRRRTGTVTIGARCNLAQQQASVVGSLLDLFPDTIRSRPHGVRTAATSGAVPTEPVAIAPIADLVGGRAILDPRQQTKQPDWSYGGRDSGAAPAALLENTPVHITARNGHRTWPEWTEWSARLGADHPLALVDDAHAAIDSMIQTAIAATATGVDVGRRTEEVADAVRTHIDVTRRVLYPMVRRVGGDEGERLADAAEAQEHVMGRLVGSLDPTDPRDGLKDLGVEVQEHAHLDDEMLELLRARLDPMERRNLADGLATARATSTVSRLHRTASRFPKPSPRLPVDRRVGAGARSDGWQKTVVQATSGVLATTPAPTRGPTAEPATPPPAPVAERADRGNGDGYEGDRPRDPDLDLDLAADGTWAPPGADRPDPGAAAAPHAEPRPQGATSGRTRTMLVGVDGSEPAAAALGWAGRLAGRLGAEVIVGNVFETDQAELSPDDYEKLLDEAERRLGTEWTEPLRGRGVDHRVVQMVGPADTLLDAAETDGADLLVVGTRGAGRVAALHLGSLAHHLAHHTRVPLAIVPIAGASAATDRIVVGVDGSDGSAAAVDWCADLAASTGAQVTAVCAFEPHPRWGLGRHASASWRTTAEAAISDGWTAPLRSAGVTLRTRIVEDVDPVTALATAAREDDAGLVVVGTRGLNAVVGLRLGRVPLQLVHHTHLPVVLIPPHR